ncbi:nicotinamide riboside transporter PnuC [Massilibacteroides sp.]|uniref:nicotinamide riboside transporter PnuC n=1 Tax=Massilibacteroides sp. TaxID=2034766 RepID=UPI00260EC6D7|nr:nicotinamide riboside transporter PnuC [Massilibacteroides sp.]MDD4513958.1 nicotinamide riboside transporter PnuC [Massilibacteroides sp.]
MEHALEIFGVVTGLLYLWLEIRQHKVMWIVGFVSSLAYVFVFFFSKIYAMMALNVYYVVISVYGFLLWSKQRSETTEEKNVQQETIIYRHLDLSVGLLCGLAAVLFFGLLYFVLDMFTDSPVALGDGFVTALSIVATWMLAKRILEHWICWVVVNVVSSYLYFTQALYPTMFLFFCYAVLAVVGYLNWKKKGVLTV